MGFEVQTWKEVVKGLCVMSLPLSKSELYELRSSIKILVETAPVVVAIIGIFSSSILHYANTNMVFKDSVLTAIIVTVIILIFSSIFAFAYSELFKKYAQISLLLSAFTALAGILFSSLFVARILNSYLLDLFIVTSSMAYLILLLIKSGIKRYHAIMLGVEFLVIILEFVFLLY